MRDFGSLWKILLISCLVFAGCAKTQITGGPVAHEKLIDGVYEGSAKGGVFPCRHLSE